MQITSEMIWSWVFKAVSATIIPLLIWINSISVDYSLLKEKVEGIEAEVKDSHDKIRILEINQAKAEQSLTNIQSSVKDIQDTVKEIYRLISTQHTVEDKER